MGREGEQAGGGGWRWPGRGRDRERDGGREASGGLSRAYMDSEREGGIAREKEGEQARKEREREEKEREKEGEQRAERGREWECSEKLRGGSLGKKRVRKE